MQCLEGDFSSSGDVITVVSHAEAKALVQGIHGVLLVNVLTKFMYIQHSCHYILKS